MLKKTKCTVVSNVKADNLNFLTKDPRCKLGLTTSLHSLGLIQTAEMVVWIKLLTLFSLFSLSPTTGFSLHTCSHFISLSLFIPGSVSESCEGQRWILACYKTRPRRSEKAPLFTREWQHNVERLNTHTNAHTYTLHVCVYSHPQACVHAHTHTYNLSHPHIDIRIQKHTCQGLSTMWAKAKKSGPPSVSLYVVSHVCYIKANLFSSHFLIWNNGMSNFHI